MQRPGGGRRRGPLHRATPLTCEVLQTRPHGFDVLRIIAAAVVLVSHADLLVTGRQRLVLRLGDGNVDLGRIGVYAFFIISGYLISASWHRDPRPRAFLRRRAARVYPGLAVSIVLTTLLAATTAPDLIAFLTAGSTWDYLWRNLLVVPYVDELPGSFSGNAVPIANGVLWTLGVEVGCYAALCLAGHRGLLRRPTTLVVLTVLMVLLSWRLVVEGLTDVAPDGVSDIVVPVMRRLELVASFAAGAAMRLVTWAPTWRAAVVAVAVVAVVAVLRLPLSLVLVPALTVVVIYLGTRTWSWSEPFLRRGDPSYGMYVYGYTVQQLMVWHGVGDGSAAVLAVVSVVAVGAVGYLSWHLVERRALRLWAPERAAARPA